MEAAIGRVSAAARAAVLLFFLLFSSSPERKISPKRRIDNPTIRFTITAGLY
jgi:hypothetical protein